LNEKFESYYIKFNQIILTFHGITLDLFLFHIVIESFTHTHSYTYKVIGEIG